MKSPIGSAIAIVVAVMTLVPFVQAAPTSPGEIRIGSVEGTVFVIREKEADLAIREKDKALGLSRPEAAVGSRVAAKEGYILRQGEAIETGPKSRAALVFSNGTVMGVEPDSYFSITKFLQDPFDPTAINIKSTKTEPTTSITEVNLKRGEVLGDVRKLNKGSKMQLTTPVGTAGIRGTKFRLTITSISADGRTFTASLSVTEGSVAFQGTGQTDSTTVTAGNSLSLSGTFGTPVSGGGQAGPLTPEAAAEITAQFQSLMESFSFTTDAGSASSTTSIWLDLDTGDEGATDVGTLQGGSGTGTGAGTGGGGGGGGGGGAQNPPATIATPTPTPTPTPVPTPPPPYG